MGILRKLRGIASEETHELLEGFLVAGQVSLRGSSLTQQPALAGIDGSLLNKKIAGR